MYIDSISKTRATTYNTPLKAIYPRQNDMGISIKLKEKANARMVVDWPRNHKKKIPIQDGQKGAPWMDPSTARG